jgi:hypothetical protein
LRGLLANAILVMVFLLAAALLTKAAYPAWDALLTANFLPKAIVVVLSIPKYLAGLVLPAVAASWVNTLYAAIGTWFGGIMSWATSLIPDETAAAPFRTTIIVSAILAVTLIIWAITRSAKGNLANDVDSPYLVFARALLAITIVSVFLDLQPLSIHWVAEKYGSLSSKSIPPSLLASLAGAATTIALFAQKLGTFLQTTRLSPKTSVQVLRLLTRIALIGAGLVLPVVLLVAYWYLTACLYAESNVPQLGTPVVARWLDLRMLITFIVIVLLFEANAYSLHQFYKDRLGKAFLFEPTDPLPPDPETLRDLKLSKIKSENAPYHILNAALNVQGSKEANRRAQCRFLHLHTSLRRQRSHPFCSDQEKSTDTWNGRFRWATRPRLGDGDLRRGDFCQYGIQHGTLVVADACFAQHPARLLAAQPARPRQ